MQNKKLHSFDRVFSCADVDMRMRALKWLYLMCVCVCRYACMSRCTIHYLHKLSAILPTQNDDIPKRKSPHNFPDQTNIYAYAHVHVHTGYMIPFDINTLANTYCRNPFIMCGWILHCRARVL